MRKLGIRAMIYIARHSRDGRRIGIREIAAGIDSPEHFIAKILQALGRKGIVQSVKGPNGGFYLDGKGRQCSLANPRRTPHLHPPPSAL